MKQIKLTQNKYALIDKEDFERLNQYKWFYNQGYATGYPKGKWNNKYFLMHRIILKLDNPKIFTDHIDRNGFNNKRISLGYFKKLINAAKAYDKKAKELFGEFARINIK